ncbi:uncharacterized protein DUF4349 [Homoserinimonas aerilata]|uniref:Uncharacterized protein DUF4349 n=2 Tax=Homoserinimonas aerilata TaxID=1162970 RepID=A0A542YGL8_9MICO|nr:uncharacterized protein DUF4349 [Homoserinimonas aerilata]
MNEASQTSMPDFGTPVQPMQDMGGAAESSAGRAADGQLQLVAPSDRQVIATGYMNITVKTPRDAADDATRIVNQAGGHVDGRTETAPRGGDRGRADLTLRIPSDALDATIEKLAALGTLEETNVSKQDVTSVAQDLDARITALQASVDRLLALMADATSTTDLITIESALSERQANLESLQSQRRSLADQVELSTITVYFGSEADAPVHEPDTFWSGLLAGWAAFVGFLSFLLVAFGVVLPWLIVPAIALALVWWLLRRRRRARGETDAPAAAGETMADPAAAATEAPEETPPAK